MEPEERNNNWPQNVVTLISPGAINNAKVKITGNEITLSGTIDNSKVAHICNIASVGGKDYEGIYVVCKLEK